MERSAGSCHFALALGFGARHTRRLPVHNLPPSISFDERAAVEKVCDLLCSARVGGCYETKRYDRSVAVLLNANVLGSVDGFRIRRLGRGRVAHIVHDLGFVYAPSCGARVDQIVSPKPIVYRSVVTRRAGQEVMQQFS